MTIPAALDASTDEDLAAAVRGRDLPGGSAASAREAFGRLYARHAPSLLAFLLARAGRAEAEDLHQLAWLRAWQSLAAAEPGPFRAWIFRIARNALIDDVRRKRPGRLEGGLDLPDAHAGRPDDRLVEAERSRALARCLGELAAEAAALVRGRLGGEDYPALCASLGLDPARAHKAFHKAKAQLRSCVERTSP